MDILLLLFILIVPLIAQSSVNSNYDKYSRVKNSIDMSGYEVARRILERNGLSYIKINLATDCFCPKKWTDLGAIWLNKILNTY